MTKGGGPAIIDVLSVNTSRSTRRSGRLFGAATTDKQTLIENGAFRVEAGKVITLEGGNQSGKSTLIGAMLGVFADDSNITDYQNVRWYHPKLRSDARLSVDLMMKIDGKNISRHSIRNSIELGLVGVFQDDDLIPTMTIEEQILLRHAASGLNSIVLYANARASNVGAQLPVEENPLASWLNRIFPLPAAARREKEVLRDAQEILKSFSTPTTDYTQLLSARPSELSGGAKAVARLAQALLTPNLRVLFLDEVFRGVERGVWPGIVGQLRKKVEEDGISIVAVTHVLDEVVEWRPNIRYEIQNKVLSRLDEVEYEFVAKGVDFSRRSYPVFDISCEPLEGAKPWLQYIQGDTLLVVDEAVQDLDLVNIITSDVRSVPYECRTLLLKGEETQKNLRELPTLLEGALAGMERPYRTVLLVGGGVTLNFAGFLASILNRGQVELVIVPTTLTAIADVSIGSKTAANFSIPGNQLGQLPAAVKHAVGTYYNPSAVVLDAKVVESLPEREMRLGLA